jgi:hypothetical protein
MIIGDPNLETSPPPRGRPSVTIDEVFRRLAVPRPDALALADAPNRQAFTDGAPRRLSYSDADRMVTAIAGRLRRMGLPTDSIIAIQLPNVVENVLTILGVLRAGMIPAPLPLLWRHAEAVAALARVGAKALMTCGRVGDCDHSHTALRVASKVFSIRYVCGFGYNLPDGVVPFDDLFSTEKFDSIISLDRERQTNGAAHVALISFDIAQGGIVPVARNHIETLAGGLDVLLESRLPLGAKILSTIAPGSFAGLCLTVLPWLLSAGTLFLHQPFDPNVLLRQRRDERCDTLVLPGPVALRLADTGDLAGDGLNSVIAAWHSPERLAASPVWREPVPVLVDASIFGEAGLIAGRRAAGGRPALLPLGPVATPRDGAGAVVVADLTRSAAGTATLRGPMVPHATFPPGVERSGLPYFKIDADGTVDTGYACRVDPVTRAMVVTGAPASIVNVGGYRFSLGALQDIVGRVDAAARLTALPDPLLGQRLIGDAADRDAVVAALEAAGANPLLAGAFRDRSALASPARASA